MSNGMHKVDAGGGRKFEHQLLFWLVLGLVMALLMAGLLAWQFALDGLSTFTLLAAVSLLYGMITYKVYGRVMDVLARLSLQLDALGHEEYTSWNLGGYPGGIIGDMRHEFAKTVGKLASRKQQYIENDLFIFHFIDLIQLPVAVLDSRHCLYHANQAFEQCTGRAWLSMNGQPSTQFGLHCRDGHWYYDEPGQGHSRWQLQSSELRRGNQQYQLVLFVSIEKALRANELNAWQKIVRVLNHEVRNSLTPIYSMTQSLKEMQQMPALSEQQLGMQRNILDVIEKRSEHLLNFVESYSALSSIPPARPQAIAAGELCQTLAALYPGLQVDNCLDAALLADKVQLEQALINLIKNAQEAAGETEEPCCLRVERQGEQARVSISDNGGGISNPDNLFVPFYSTKPSGSGIGLVLSRELVRNQGGELTLANRDDGRGAVATVLLPLAS